MAVSVSEPKRTVVTKKSGDLSVEPSELLLSVRDSGTFTAERSAEILSDEEAYKEAQDWLSRHWDSMETPSKVGLEPGFPFPGRTQLEANLTRLSAALEKLLSAIDYGRVEISSGFRPPRHNAEVGGVSTSRHVAGLAADISVYDDTGSEIGPLEVAYKVRDSNAPFEKVLVYDNFVHLALARTEGGYNGTEIDATSASDGSGSVGGDQTIRSADYIESSSRFEQDIELPETGEEDQTSKRTFKGNPTEIVLKQLGVKQGEGGEQAYEDGKKLVGKEPPVEGEMDIGDLRFGSVMFDEVDPSDLNQVSAINQQNAGSVGMAQMLRTDMNPVLSDNTVLPETVVTLSINATERDDVNRRLRPLIAMHRRMPFCLARNSDLSRMMLGVGLTTNTADRLERLYPEMSAQERRDLADGLNDRNPSDIWVPVTLRDISVQSQPGSGNLYQAHVVLRYANVSPYVPQMRLWEDSETAVEWAQYVSDRSRRGSLIQNVNGSEADIVTRDEEQRDVIPPDLEAQAKSPYQSFPMKKFYRGLLEEFQPHYYEALKERGDTDQLPPIARQDPNPDTATVENAEPVYEPAYPIGQNGRAFEYHEKGQDFGLRFLMVQSLTTRSARMSRTIRTFKKEIDYADTLNQAANLYAQTPGAFAEYGELGYVSPLLMSGVQEYNEIMLGVRSTSSAFQKVANKIGRRVESGEITIPDSVDRYRKQDNAPGIGRQASGLEPLGDDPLALNVVREAGYVNTGGLVNFGVPGTDRTQSYVPFGDKVQKIQEGILHRYAQVIHRINDRAQIEHAGVVYTTPADDPLAERWAAFLNEQQVELIEERTDHELSPDQTPEEFLKKHSTQEIRRAFSQYVLRLDFIKEVGRFFDRRAEDSGREPDVRIEGIPVREEIQNLVDTGTQLSTAINDEITGSRQSLEEYYRGQGDEMKGFLDLSNSSIESVQLRFSNRFADMEADGYPNPTTQHIGGGNAEVTLEITTNNQLLLDQLGALKQSQQSLAEIRKSKDVVPPLIQIMGEGTFLRSLGIKQLAYRSHTVTTDPDKPGSYQIRLDLIQDEETLVRAEEFNRVGGLRRGQIFNTEATLPLSLPMWSARGRPGQDRVMGRELEGYDPQSPLSVWDMLVGFSPLSLNDQPFSPPDRTPVPSEQSFPGRSDPTAWSAKSLFSDTEIPYRQLEGPNGTEGLQEFQQEWNPMSADVTYILPEDREDALSAIEMEIQWEGAGGDTRTVDVERAYATQLLAPIVSFLDYAKKELDKQVFRRLVSQVNSALSTTGYKKGLILSWITLLFSGSTESAITDLTGDLETGTGVPTNPMSPGQVTSLDPEVKTEIVPDNITLKAASILSGLVRDTETGTFGSALRIAADELGRVIVQPDETRAVYKQWLQNNGRTIPAEARHPQANKKVRPYDFTDTEEKVQELASWYQKMETQTPSAYPDLLFPPIRDPKTQTHIIAPDFPFGPGTSTLGKDQYLEDYEFADSMRQVAAVKKATIGLEALQDYITPSGDDDGGDTDARGGNPDTVRRDRVEPPFSQSASGEQATAVGHNIERVRAATEEAVSDIRDQVATGSNDFPFDVREEGEGGYFDQMMQWAENNGAFSAQLDRNLQVKDLARLKRVSATMKYVTKLIEAANIAAGENAHSEKATKDGTKLTQQEQENIKKATEALRNGDVNYFFRNESVRDAMSSYQNVDEVQEDFFLVKERNELIDLWRADPIKIAKKHGYYDQTTEPRRQELMEKLKETWRDYLGMRRAFPSYMFLKAGPTGTGRFQVMSDVYSWTAVQSITRRNLRENAGEQCEVVISNMRKQVEGGNRMVELFNQESYDSPQQKIETGDHMYIYMGYGPDEEHLDGFPGRVTRFTPGPITKIQLSSYSTTLNNMPNGGSGFAVNGRDGQQTIAETVLYTLSQTEGLEGLGRSTMFSAQDPLGREFRGDAEDDFTTSMALSLWRTMGSPLGDTILGQSNEEAQNLVGMVADSGLGRAKELLLGDPQIYENIWVAASGEQAGYVDTFAGKFDELLTEGKGWGWTSLPGETTWAQLNKMSDLWANYIVTARPYNQNASPAELAKHPLRQTLYFGPKEGVYIHSSKSTGEHDTFSNLTEEELKSVARQAYRAQQSGGLGRPGSGDSTQEILQGLYKEVFMDGFLLKEIHKALGGAGGGPWYQELSDGVSEYFTSASSAGFWTSIFEAGIAQDAISTDSLPANEADALKIKISTVFPNLYDNINAAARRVEAVGEARDDYVQVFRDQSSGAVEPNNFLEVFSWPFTSTESSDADERFLDDIREMKARFREAIISGFVEDLQELAVAGPAQQNLNAGSLDHPVIQQIREKLLQKGLVPGKRTKPVQQHHFANTYEHVLRNGIQASDRDRDFANKVTLVWPSDPDERLNAFFGSGGEKMKYSVKANPMIAEDYIVEKEIPYMNMRYDLQEEAGLIGSQLEKAPGGQNFGALIARRSRILQRIQDGEEGLADERKEVEKAIHKVIKELGSNVVRPKYSVVATNNLNQGMSYMYQGQITMLGNPDIKPHHVLHLWDDVEEMHGPVETRGVLQKFDSGGYRTVALPALHSNVRGADSTMDTTWMGYAQQLQSTYSYLERLASATGDVAWMATKGVMYAAAVNFIEGGGRTFLKNIGMKGAARAAGYATPIGWAIGIADAVWTTLDFLEETGARKERLFLGMMTGALDANPLSFIPLTYRGKPYTAGLTGATGPGSITDVMVRDINDLRREPGNVGRNIFDTIRQYGGFMGPEPASN